MSKSIFHTKALKHALISASIAIASSSVGCASPPIKGSAVVVADAETQASQSPAPKILFTDVRAGTTKGGPSNLGVPIAIFGKGFGAKRGDSRVTIGGTEVAGYLGWGANNAHNKDLDMIVVQPGSIHGGGPITVTVNGVASNSDYSFTPTGGSIVYVSPDGSDSKACSESAPCATVLHAVSIMKPGDTLLLRQGTYAEGEIWIRSPQGGTKDRPKVIRNYPGEEVLMVNSARDFYVDADDITVSGLNFRNGKALISVGWASRDQRDNWFVNNTFAGNIGYAAIEITGHDHLIAGNVCDISGSAVGTMGHCYYLAQGSNFKVLYNVASGAPGYGIHLYEERREEKDFQRVIRDVLIEGNILKNSKQRSGMIIAISDAGKLGNHIENVTVRNNIFFNNNHAGLVIEGAVENVSVYNNTFYQNGLLSMYAETNSGPHGVDIRNNLFYQSKNSTCSTECGNMEQGHIQIGKDVKGVTVSGNSYHPGKPVILGGSDATAITGEVKFVNESGQDFHVQSGSSVIDRGQSLPAVLTDHDGKPRPQGTGYDIGAFEF